MSEKSGADGLSLCNDAYIDHAGDTALDGDSIERDITANKKPMTCPFKLYRTLKLAERDGHDYIFGWQPHGRSFIVRDPAQFTVLVLSTYFGGHQWHSFQRQLSLYGFRRLCTGRDKGAYYHPVFLRKRAFLLSRIKRVAVKGTGVRMGLKFTQEPDFWAMPWVDHSKTLPVAFHPAPDPLHGAGSLSAVQDVSRLVRPRKSESVELFGDDEIDQVLLKTTERL